MRYPFAPTALSCLLIASAAIADDTVERHDQIVARAFQSLSRDFKTEWSFTETKASEDMVFVGNYDPRRADDERWSLVSVDGREPSQDEREAYEDDKNNDEQVRISTDKDEEEDDDATVVNFDTLELVEETDAHWLFSFVPKADNDGDDDAAILQHVDGLLKIAKAGHYVAFIDLRSERPFKPTTGVKIHRFETRLEFAPAAVGGPIVPHTVDVAVKGRAMLLIKFDERESLRYGDYEFVGD